MCAFARHALQGLASLPPAAGGEPGVLRHQPLLLPDRRRPVYESGKRITVVGSSLSVPALRRCVEIHLDRSKNSARASAPKYVVVSFLVSFSPPGRPLREERNEACNRGKLRCIIYVLIHVAEQWLQE
jgi:hypothetical protein